MPFSRCQCAYVGSADFHHRARYVRGSLGAAVTLESSEGSRRSLPVCALPCRATPSRAAPG